jgi:hypothetical protein
MASGPGRLTRSYPRFFRPILRFARVFCSGNHGNEVLSHFGYIKIAIYEKRGNIIIKTIFEWISLILIYNYIKYNIDNNQFMFHN